MFFIGLTICMIAWISGSVFLYQGDYVIGGGLIGCGILVFIAMMIFYRTAKKKHKNNKLDCDCLPIVYPTSSDCDRTPDCDCNPDCST
ncbi:hypothetical protein SMD22_02155 (plasmid) [Brevibacillus halotolerans]|nr:hypothetical protein SMD22_02155 [Brevibacillus halotolerans]